MNESPPARSPAHLAPARGRHLRSTSDASPTRQRNTDDLLTNLTPRTVVDAFRNPSGSLKACIEAASPSEQAFALRVAVASNSIHEWLAELSAWPWPAGGGSAGFEMAAAKRRRAPDATPQAGDEELEFDPSYSGSLPTAEVARYEKRIDEISQGLEELDIEEIKSQVLNNHIMPLSRPGTPIMDSGRSISSLCSFAKMDDLTALVTATTVQALPNLSKLTRLMTAWNFRLLVLRKIPVFLESLADAEVALQSGWNAINLGPTHGAATDSQDNAAGTGPATLSRAEFDVMKSVLGRKVAKTGRDLDAMLDVLEGQPDTLPEAWIDRVDALEHGYGEWTVACERKVKETDLAALAPQAVPTNAPERSHQDPDGTAVETSSVSGSHANGEGPSRDIASTFSPRPETLPPVIRIHPTVEDEKPQSEDDVPRSDTESDQSASNGPDHAESPVDPLEQVQGEDKRSKNARASQSPSDSELPDPSEPAVSATESRARSASSASQASTVMFEAPSVFTDSFSSDLLDQGTPERPRQRPMDADEDVSGFPSFRSSTRSMSVSFNDKLTINELPGFPSRPGTPILEDDAATEPGSPSEMSMPSTDDQLQQQISEILESVPAKIRLTAEPPAINLNPPDFKLPTARKGSRSDAIPRSQSTLSLRSAYSRSATPSFTLAPARSSRPRHQRGNQEIKLYHLSRSNGEAPIKLFIRCVGEHGERVMVRVGGGWADLGEYLKEYASHHLRRAAGAAAVNESKVEVKDVPRNGPIRADATPPSRPTSAMDAHSPVSPLKLRKVRRPPTAAGGDEFSNPPPLPRPTTSGSTAAVRPKTPLANAARRDATPPSDASSSSSRRSSRPSPPWDDDDESSALGMAGPRAKQIQMSEESRAWVESVKEKVRIASGERKMGVVHPPPPPVPVPVPVLPPVISGGGGVGGNGNGSGGLEASLMERGEELLKQHQTAGKVLQQQQQAMFGDMGKVGSTKRLFIKRG